VSTSDDEMLLLLTAEQIRRREFATVRRGYDPEQVRIFLTSIANQFEGVERELNELRLEVASAAERSAQAADHVEQSEPAPAEDPYEALSKRFAGLIETADQEAERILENAKSEASQALDEARSEADRIRVDAQAHAEEGRQEVADLLERATTEADRALSALTERRQSFATQLDEMRAKLIAMADDLAAPIEEAARVDDEDTVSVPEPEPTKPKRRPIRF
jgi:DivIVA domain-containing protein